MRSLIALTILGLVLVAPLAVMAGDCGGGARGASASSVGDFGCANACPLAQTAATHRATGNEAARASVAVREAIAKTVSANLERI